MTGLDSPTVGQAFIYLDPTTLQRFAPSPEQQVELAGSALAAAAASPALAPPKRSIEVRPGCLIQAMPAIDPPANMFGLKWVSVFAGNRRSGRPSTAGLIVLNRLEDGSLLCVMPASYITQIRTAAVSAYAVRRLAGHAEVLAILGCGTQGRGHVALFSQLWPGLRVKLFDRHADRAAATQTWAAGLPGVGQTATALDAREAVEDADVVVTASSLTAGGRLLENIPPPDRCVLIALDEDTYVTPSLARSSHFVVDNVPQFLDYRATGHFEDFPDPDGSLDSAERRAHQRAVVVCMGVSMVDLAFATSIYSRAGDSGITLPT